MITINKAQNEDMEAIFDLLQRSDLTTNGLRDHLETTLVAKEGETVIGSAALELYEPYALLRSVAVEETKRGQDLGKKLTVAALDLAYQRGVKNVYLLTEDAHDYYARFFGFRKIQRNEVPEPVQQSIEFISACSQDATVMTFSFEQLCCCQPSEKEVIRSGVQAHYAERARQSSSCCEPSNGTKSLYQLNLLDEIPDDIASFSLGCGDPITLASLKEGETVLDLGSGGGLDCFLAAKRVGKTGKVIGVDMTPEMLQKARATAERLKIANVSFREGYLENLPVEDDSVDVIISNCVVNLSPDKSAVFTEMVRVLKPDGRVAISDIVKLKDLPEQMQQDIEVWASCAAGALRIDVLEEALEEAGFIDIQIIPQEIPYELPPEIPTDVLRSARITARKQASN
jgi:SAM-dependent methyltransferase/N-acetylglutamate synthase-like GNAT family acetyltransferase